MRREKEMQRGRCSAWRRALSLAFQLRNPRFQFVDQVQQSLLRLTIQVGSPIDCRFGRFGRCGGSKFVESWYGQGLVRLFKLRDSACEVINGLAFGGFS